MEITPELIRTSRFDIDIPKFEKWNPGGDKHRKWIKLDVNFFKDEKVHSMTSASRECYLSILLVRAQLGRSLRGVTLQWVHSELAAHPGHGVSSMLKLSELGVIVLSNFQPRSLRGEERRGEKRRKEAHDRENEAPAPAEVPEPKPPAPAPPAPPPTRNVIARYCELWKARYGASPPISGKVAGNLKTLVKDFGEPRAVALLESYLKMTDAWFLTKRHDVPTLLTNLNAVVNFEQTGRNVTRQDIKALESKTNYDNLREAVERGEI